MEELARALRCYKHSHDGYEEEELKRPGPGTYERPGKALEAVSSARLLRDAMISLTTRAKQTSGDWIYRLSSDFGRLMGRVRGYSVSSLRHGPCRTSEDAVTARRGGGWKDSS